MLSSELMYRRAKRTGECVRRGRGAGRGFTLVELMAVVAITGILAGLAIASLRQRAFASDATSAKVVVRSIAAAEEHYRAENQVYLDVSASGNAGWYPKAAPTRNTKMAFWNKDVSDNSDEATNRWRILGPDIRQPVGFGFKANAGLPDTAPVFDNELAGGVQPTLTEPWYLIQARADANGNGIGCMVGAASWTPVTFVVNEGE
jgi:prepilin-type N-terminal cleavage/methylation domain-containing protein